MEIKNKTESKNDQSAPSESSERGCTTWTTALSETGTERAWRLLAEETRQQICKEYGFADYKTYAQYRWKDFQPHTRAALLAKVMRETYPEWDDIEWEKL